MAQSSLGALTAEFVKDVVRAVSAGVRQDRGCVGVGRAGKGNWI